LDITADILLRAYAAGIFPMAPDRGSDVLEWYEPSRRGVLPLEGFHVPKKLRRLVRSGRFSVTSDQDFIGMMRLCAAAAPGREETWISEKIIALYSDLYRMGHAHSIEVWEGERVVGGLYGVSLGGAFFGESMVSCVPNASKVALVHLVEGLRQAGFRLLDTQFRTDHLGQFGCVDIPVREYRRRLEGALHECVFWPQSFALEALAIS